VPIKKPKTAKASLENMRRIFTVPQSGKTTLGRIDLEISNNLQGFLNNRIITEEIEPHILEKDFKNIKIPEEPMFVSQQTKFLLEKVVAQSVHTASPSFIGHMTSAIPYFMIPLAKIMIALNQNPVKIETSKAFTPLERQVIAMLHNLIFKNSESFYESLTQSYEHSLGTLCSGGTIANITGLWAARNRMFQPEGDFKGIAAEGFIKALRYKNLDGLAVLVSKRGHYSLSKSVDILGLGYDNLVGVPTTSENKIDTNELKSEITRLKSQNIGILAIVGIAGTTETGNIDPLDELADICEDIGCHFHVDGAWGAATLFSERYAPLLKGIERADSVTIDAHKQLLVPMGAGLCLFKDHTSLNFVEHNANYIIRKGSRDLGKHTLEGGRPGMAMLVHSGLKIIGRKGYELIIDLGIGKAKQFAKMIETHESFELMTAPELNLLTYRYIPTFAQSALKMASQEQAFRINELLNDLTEKIQKQQRSHGKTFVSRTTLGSHKYFGQSLTVLRSVLANPLTTRTHLTDILNEQTEYGLNFTAEDQIESKILSIMEITDKG